MVQTFEVGRQILQEVRVFGALVYSDEAFVSEFEIVIQTVLPAVELMEVDLVTVPQNVDRPHEVDLVFVHAWIRDSFTPCFCGVCHSSLNPHALPPSHVIVWLMFLKQFEQFNKGHLGSKIAA